MDGRFPVLFFLTLVSLWVSALLFLLPLRKKEPFRLRLLLCLCVESLIYVALSLLFSHLHLMVWMGPLLRFAAVTLLFWQCGDLPTKAVLYCAVWTVMIHDLAVELSTALYQLLPQSLPVRWLPPLLLWAVGLTIVGLTIARWMPDNKSYHTGPRQLTIAFLLLLLFLGMDWLYACSGLSRDPLVGLMVMLLIKCHCVTILYLQHSLFQKSAIRQELSMLNHLWVQQKDQYALSKENISLINQKCHDLKHQIQAMRVMFSDEKREDYFHEVEQSVRIYEVLAKTGNEVLDTVLTEKSLYCEANGIQANCVADGSLLSFMDPVDLYTIFGNALDNAIESVKDNADREKRIIDVLVYAEKQMLVIQIINPVARPLQFDEEGLPMSTKVNDGYHGFGLKSIRHTVKRYGGFLTVKVENGCFYLQILLPMQR